VNQLRRQVLTSRNVRGGRTDSVTSREVRTLHVPVRRKQRSYRLSDAASSPRDHDPTGCLRRHGRTLQTCAPHRGRRSTHHVPVADPLTGHESASEPPHAQHAERRAVWPLRRQPHINGIRARESVHDDDAAHRTVSIWTASRIAVAVHGNAQMALFCEARSCRRIRWFGSLAWTVTTVRLGELRLTWPGWYSCSPGSGGRVLFDGWPE
jgi:hypothetical protein